MLLWVGHKCGHECHSLMSALHFDVPGWNVPVTEPAHTVTSRKRKRPSNTNLDDIKLAQVNFDKLLSQLRGDTKSAKKQKSTVSEQSSPQYIPPDPKEPNVRRRKWEKNKSSKVKAAISGKGELQEAPHEALNSTKQKAKQSPIHQNPKNTSNASHRYKDSTSEMDLTPMQIAMRQKLGGARFRCVTHFHKFSSSHVTISLINETLYKSDSTESLEMMRKDPSIYCDASASTCQSRSRRLIFLIVPCWFQKPSPILAV